MYKVALGLFVGFGPLFILCLIFPSTKQLFSKWLYYGIGTTFSLAVLAFMVGVASKLVLKVGAVLLAKYMLAMYTPLGSGSVDGLNTIAMQQGGLGLILTILLITCPPMAAMFFQGVLGQAMTMYSQFGVGGGQARDPQGNPVGGQRPATYNQDQAGSGNVRQDNLAGMSGAGRVNSSPAPQHAEAIKPVENAQVANARNQKGG